MKYPLKLESFYSLSLMIPPSVSGGASGDDSVAALAVTLNDCLKYYFKSEQIKDMKCEKCSSQERATSPRNGFIKKQAIAKLPECLCLQIQLLSFQKATWSDSNFEMVKNNNHVQFPLHISLDDVDESLSISHVWKPTKQSQIGSNNYANQANMPASLSLKPFFFNDFIGSSSGAVGVARPRTSPTTTTTTQCTKSKKRHYELVSSIVHYGSAHTGHFIEFRKSLHKTRSDWLRISDNDIIGVKLASMMNNRVYMLFYDMVADS